MKPYGDPIIQINSDSSFIGVSSYNFDKNYLGNGWGASVFDSQVHTESANVDIPTALPSN